MVSAAFKYVPQPAATTFAFPFCIYLSSLCLDTTPKIAQRRRTRGIGRVRADHSLYRTKGDQLTGPTVLKVGEDQPKLTQPLSLRVGGVNRRTGGAAPPAGV